MANLNNDIERYLRGELTSAEMHALEKKALHDPFLAEALEGAQQAGAQNFAVDLQLIQRSIHEKTRKRKRKIMPIMDWGLYTGIAAGLLLLTVSYFVIISMIDQQKASEQQALEETTSQPQKDAAAQNDSLIALNAAPTSEKAEPQPSSPVQPAKKKSKSFSGPGKPADQHELATQTQESPADRAGEEQEAKGSDVVTAHTDRSKDLSPVDGVTSDTDKAVQQEALAKSSTSERSKAVLPLKVVRGKVTSAEDGIALPGVNVLIKGTSIGAVTDEHGNYELPLNAPDQSLVFGFIGFKSKEIPAGQSQEINVQLENDLTELSEVVVVGYGATRDAPALQFAEPEGGRQAFQKYLEEKLQYPQQALDNKVEGKVTVQFTVEPSGKLSDFKILKGLGYGCDDEVIRLIKHGPAWSPTKQNSEPVKDKVKVRLKFDLPEKK